MSRTLFRYVLFEVLGPFAIGLVILTFVLVMFQLQKLIDLIVSYGVKVVDAGLVLLYIFPTFFTFTVPMAFLLAVLLTISRLSSDSELTALKAGGVGLAQLYPPILVLSLVMTLATAGLSLFADPWGKSAFKDLLLELGRQKATVGIVEHVFNDSLKDTTLYIDRVVPEKDLLEGVFLADQRDGNAPLIVTASRGRIGDSGSDNTALLELEDGVVHRLDPADPTVYETVQFDSYRIQIDLAKAMGGSDQLKRTYLDMDNRELAAYVDSLTDPKDTYERRRAWTEFHRRFAMPFVCIAFGLIALPLGISPPRSGRSRGFTTSIVLLCLFYLMFRAGENLSWKSVIHPAVAMWTPNVVLLGLGVFLLHRKANERPVWVLDVTTDLASRAAQWVRGKLGVNAARDEDDT